MATTPDRSTPDRLALLENHLAFTASHRGRVLRSPEAIRIESDLPGFSCLLPLAPADDPALRAHLEGAGLVRLGPWSACAVQDLTRRGFAPRGALVFMTLARPVATGPAPAYLEIAEVRDATTLGRFSEVQVAGFLEGEPAAEVARWRGWLGAANRGNLGAPGQSFFLARVDGEPAGVLLLLHDGAVAGIYAVSTAPAFRRRGISTALLARAANAAAAQGCTCLSLQVAQGSYAEGFYRALGFATACVSPLLTRGGAA